MKDYLDPLNLQCQKRSKNRHMFSRSSNICSLAYLLYMQTIVVHISGLGLTQRNLFLNLIMKCIYTLRKYKCRIQDV